MLKSLVLVAVFMAVGVQCDAAFAHFRLPSASESAPCQAPYTFIDFTDKYKAGAGVPTKMCIIDKFETPCATYQGIVACNNHDASCETSDRSLDSDINPALAAVYNPGSTVRACVSAGKYQHPEAKVLAPTQTVVSFVVFLIVAAYTVFGCFKKCNIATIILYFTILVTCILLIVSFWYLNAIIAVAVACLAMSAYSTKNNHAVSLGMLAIFAVLMWFTFDGGLGWYQHHARFDGSAVDPANNFYEAKCNNYYRFSYATPLDYWKDNSNPDITSHAVCLREWVAAELFFVILLKLELALLIAAGGYSLA